MSAKTYLEDGTYWIIGKTYAVDLVLDDRPAWEDEELMWLDKGVVGILCEKQVKKYFQFVVMWPKGNMDNFLLKFRNGWYESADMVWMEKGLLGILNEERA